MPSAEHETPIALAKLDPGLVAWLLALSGHDTDAIGPPAGGRAPGWAAGLVVATRAQQGRDRSPSCEGPSALPARWRAT